MESLSLSADICRFGLVVDVFTALQAFHDQVTIGRWACKPINSANEFMVVRLDT